MKFVTPANQLSGPHKDSLCRISHMNDGCLASCSQVGRAEIHVWVIRRALCVCGVWCVVCVCVCVYACVHMHACVCVCCVCVYVLPTSPLCVYMNFKPTHASHSNSCFICIHVCKLMTNVAL